VPGVVVFVVVGTGAVIVLVGPHCPVSGTNHSCFG
jgi:hypothetical protein